jgi:Icc-related predicted phosphoesterase
MKIVLISDTHNQHNKMNIPDGDILIHAGDFTSQGKIYEITAFNKWLESLTHKHKIIIAGNHDLLFENQPSLAESLITNAIYLNDSGITLENLKFWGSPVSPRFYDWAFNKDRGEAIKRHWDLIPDGIDILITHCPPYGILDKNNEGEHVGCEELSKAIPRIKPKIVVFGHIHEGYGIINQNDISFINACSLNERYRLVNEPVVIEI